MRRAASLPALTPAETVALSVERLAIALVLLFFLGAILVSDMNGYQGSDDARYIAGAEAWLAEGLHIARNHWETRLPYVLLIAATGTTATSPGPAFLLPDRRSGFLDGIAGRAKRAAPVPPSYAVCAV